MGNPQSLAPVLASNPQVEWVHLPWAGVNAYAKLFAEYRDLQLPLWTSGKGAYGEPVAEHALALTLALLRRLPEKAVAKEWAAERSGTTLFGSRVVIVGAGGIARALIELLRPFSAHITVVRRSAVALAGADNTITTEGLVESLRDADVLIVAAASTSQTRNVLSGREFAAMKPSAVIVNVSRGDLVDTNALVTALHTNQISGAGLDVTQPEPLPKNHSLWQFPQCIITSHSADTAEMTMPLLAERVAFNTAAMLRGGPFLGVIDLTLGY